MTPAAVNGLIRITDVKSRIRFTPAQKEKFTKQETFMMNLARTSLLNPWERAEI